LVCRGKGYYFLFPLLECSSRNLVLFYPKLLRNATFCFWYNVMPDIVKYCTVSKENRGLLGDSRDQSTILYCTSTMPFKLPNCLPVLVHQRWMGTGFSHLTGQDHRIASQGQDGLKVFFFFASNSWFSYYSTRNSLYLFGTQSSMPINLGS
jgi:hypothetical protein